MSFPPPGSGKRVLIVEDDARSARTLARLLGEDGYVVELAFDGGAAVARLGREPAPDALVVDYMLPHIDGVAVASYARSLFPDLPVFVVTSYQEVVSRMRTGLHPPAVMLPKPLIYADLTRELERAL